MARRTATAAAAAATALAVVALLATGADAAGNKQLPKYIKTCSRNDPQLNACGLRSGREAIPQIVNGDAKLKIPSLNPLRIKEIRVDQDGSVGLRLTLSDVDIFGLTASELRDIRLDIKNKRMGLSLFVPQIQLLGHYNISGRILILPIRGSGPSNITLDNMPLDYNMQYTLVPKKGKDYLRIVSSDVAFDTSKAHFIFENLFDGDERLRENVRHVVNDNWRQVVDDVGPFIVRAIGDVVDQLIGNVCNAVPFDEIFPEAPPPA